MSTLLTALPIALIAVGLLVVPLVYPMKPPASCRVDLEYAQPSEAHGSFDQAG